MRRAYLVPAIIATTILLAAGIYNLRNRRQPAPSAIPDVPATTVQEPIAVQPAIEKKMEPTETNNEPKTRFVKAYGSGGAVTTEYFFLTTEGRTELRRRVPEPSPGGPTDTLVLSANQITDGSPAKFRSIPVSDADVLEAVVPDQKNPKTFVLYAIDSLPGTPDLFLVDTANHSMTLMLNACATYKSSFIPGEISPDRTKVAMLKSNAGCTGYNDDPAAKEDSHILVIDLTTDKVTEYDIDISANESLVNGYAVTNSMGSSSVFEGKFTWDEPTIISVSVFAKTDFDKLPNNYDHGSIPALKALRTVTVQVK